VGLDQILLYISPQADQLR